MQKTTPVKIGAAFGAATLLAIAAPLAASAHVTVDPSTTGASSYSVLTFSMSHGCEGSPTTAVTFTVPDGIESVSPTVNPGWTIAESGNQVVYTAAEPLADGLRTTFELSAKLPDLPAGERLDFPVLQECDAGSTDWAEIAADGEPEPEHPAPFIVLTESTGDAHAAPEAGQHDATEAEAPAGSEDIVARVLGIGGLVLGTVGVVLGLRSRRKEATQ